MARLLLVQIEDDAKAEGLADKLGDRVIAQFKMPAKFCECDLSVMADRHVTPLGMKNRWRICPACRRPREGMLQQLTPIDQLDLPPQGVNIRLLISPPHVDPHGVWTPEKIARKNAEIDAVRVKMNRGAKRQSKKDRARRRAAR